MKKRILFAVFLLCMIVFGHPDALYAAENGDYQYYENTDGTITITKYQGSGGEIVIPSEIGGKRVTDIYAFAFQNANLADVVIPDSITGIGRDAFANSSLTSVVIGKGITSIPMCAFSGCSSLKRVVFPESVRWIGDSAFGSCRSLESITFPDSVYEIGECAFYNCSSLTSITIPGSVKQIKNNVFGNCSSLANVTIQEGVKSISCKAFLNCTSMTSITIPGSVSYLGARMSTASGYEYGHAFSGCSSLTEIRVESGNEWYDSRENCNGIIETKSNTLVVGCKNTKIPNNVTNIGETAFQGQTGLTGIIIPDSVEKIGKYAFKGCSSLENIAVPGNVSEIMDFAFEDCSKLASIVIADGVTRIENGVFWGCSSLESIIIPDSVRRIGGGAFGDCNGLTSVTIPDNGTEIGTEMFFGCSSLATSIIIPDGQAKIWDQTFYGCRSLTDIYIPGSVKSVGIRAFYNCSSLTDIYYSGSESEWASISTGLYNEALKNAAIHYNSKWDFSLFQSPSTTYNNRLALIAADMSEKAEQGEDAIRALYDSYGLTDCEYSNFGFNESAAFAIGQTVLEINGEDTAILVITARGSTTWWEFIGDLFKGVRVDFLDTKVWGNIHEFYETIWNGTRNYIYNHPDLWTKKNIKILINGHSLGGAAANMLGAMLTKKDGMNEEVPWEIIGKENIYVYTFGAIKVLTEENEDRNISGGYENIHNIYNFYDSFGPHGNWKDQNASAIKAKFGHTELYYLDEGETGWLMWNRTSNNHNMSNYKKALEQNKVSCSERAKEKTKKRIEKIEKQLSGIWQSVKRIVSQIAVLCPVDVEIYASDGSLAGKVAGNEIEAMLSNKVYICTEGDRKYIYLLNDDGYTVKLKGTDAGTMTYSVQNIDMDTGEVMGEKTFTDVSLESSKQFTSSVTVEENSTVGIEEDNIKLFVVKENGEPEKEVLADGNGTEAVIEEEPGKPENPDKPGTGNGTEHPGLPDSDNKNPDTEKTDNKKPGGSGTDGKAPSVKVKSIKISGISKKIAAGKKITLKAAVSPSNATSKSVKWKSSNTKYATVNGKGVVKLKKAGVGKTVTITASAKDGSGKKASYKIKIMKGIVKDVKISGKATRTAKSGTSVKLKASVKASNGANKALQWKSSNTKYASVNGKGKVTLKKAGKGKTVKITAMATDGSGKKAAVKIKIK